jgi:hypothetical protein
MKYAAKRVTLADVNDGIRHEMQFHACALDSEAVICVHQPGQGFIESPDRVVKSLFYTEATAARVRQVWWI